MDIVEREALLQRAAEAESRLYSFRRHRSARSKSLADFIQQRAPELWADYAALSVNGSLYSEEGSIEPTYEREINILLHRAEAAELVNTEAATEIATLRERVAVLEGEARDLVPYTPEEIEIFQRCFDRGVLDLSDINSGTRDEKIKLARQALWDGKPSTKQRSAK